MEGTRDIDYATFVIWILVLAALPLPYMSIKCISFWSIALFNNHIP